MWKSLGVCEFQRKLWNALAYAILWSLWLPPNEKIFNDKFLSLEEVCSLVLHYVAIWLRALDESFPYTRTTILSIPEAIKAWFNTSPRIRPSVCWDKPDDM